MAWGLLPVHGAIRTELGRKRLETLMQFERVIFLSLLNLIIFLKGTYFVYHLFTLEKNQRGMFHFYYNSPSNSLLFFSLLMDHISCFFEYLVIFFFLDCGECGFSLLGAGFCCVPPHRGGLRSGRQLHYQGSV